MNYYRSGLVAGLPPVTLNIIIINVIVWLAQVVFIRRGIDLTDTLGLYYFESEGFRLYQLLTYLFLHDSSSFLHVFSNMFAVFMFGRTLEQVWGSKRFFSYYMATGIGAALVQMFVIFLRIQSVKSGISGEALHDVYTGGFDLLNQGMNYADTAMGNLNLLMNTVTVGASGAVFGILLAFGMLFPNTELFIIPFPFPIKAKWFVFGYGVFELFFGIRNVPGDNVAHFAHLGGMLFGFFMILYWKKRDKIHGRFY